MGIWSCSRLLSVKREFFLSLLLIGQAKVNLDCHRSCINKVELNWTGWFSPNCEFRCVAALFTGFNVTKQSYAQYELFSNASNDWNVLKRINNNYFSSNSPLFFTNTQQLKAFFFPGRAAPMGVQLRSDIPPRVIRLFLTCLAWDLSGRCFICRGTHRRLTLQLGVITAATSSRHLGNEARHDEWRCWKHKV